MIAEYGADYADEHRFAIPEGCHWRDVRAKAQNVGTALRHAMHELTLVPRPSDLDRLRDQRRIGRSSGATSSSMLRA